MNRANDPDALALEIQLREDKLLKLFVACLDALKEHRPFLDPLRIKQGDLLLVFTWFARLNVRNDGPGTLDLYITLFARLVQRWNSRGLTNPQPPTAMPSAGGMQALRALAIQQQVLLRDLGGPRQSLGGSALDAFASGSLDLTRQQKLTCSGRFKLPPSDFSFHGPDGAIFFTWSEFALLAADDAGKNPDAYKIGADTWNAEDWRHFAALLVRAQHIFLRSFSGTLGPDGLPVPTWSFGCYESDIFRPVKPEVVAGFDFTGCTLVDLEVYATRCLGIAMPGGVDPTPKLQQILRSSQVFCPA